MSKFRIRLNFGIILAE